jgi:outer membrane receptor protein involved in Fe transport
MEIGEEYSMSRMRLFAILLLCGMLCLTGMTAAQTETATVSGRVSDSSGAVVPGATVELQSVERGIVTATATNGSGIYVFPSVHPGQYRITVKKEGFRRVDVLDLVVNVQDHIEQNINLQVGSISESITVSGGAPLVNTEDASVSTVVDRQFAENLPMNGRSFQTLINLTPGVVITASDTLDGGQFTVNGQRAISNYWMVDGVSASFGVTAAGGFIGNGAAGALPSTSILGGTNSLVSVDALQEFRIQTSTYAPEFGRTPGGQISIVTRSGTNGFHGTLFDYFRNDALDANDWFNGYTNNPPLPKAKERQNDFGGTFSGPILKDRTFFFFSYEGLRLRLPHTTLTTVPDASFTPGGTTNSRQNAATALQPYLNAYPLPERTSPEIFVSVPCDPATDPSCPPSGQKQVATGSAQFNSSYSNPATLNAYSLRIDQKLNSGLTLFGRYNYSPSSARQRAVPNGQGALSRVSVLTSGTRTATIGLTWAISPMVSNDFRFNYSRSNGQSQLLVDNFHGAIPLTSPPFPAPFTNANASFDFGITSLLGGFFDVGLGSRNLQRQINLTDGLSVQKGSHSLKFGVDFRRLSPVYEPQQYIQQANFDTVATAAVGSASFAFFESNKVSALLLHNLGAFAQDTWRITSRLSLTVGLRWDVDFAPSSARGPSLSAVTGYNLNDLSRLTLAASGTPPFRTTYGNVAPRVGAAYQLSPSQEWQTVLRGGFGVFYDLATSQAGNAYGGGLNYPFGALSFMSGTSTPFPFSASVDVPPPITIASLRTGFSTLYAFDPNLRLPYTLEWNVALEQALGKQQKISASYIGAVGRRLMQTAVTELSNNPNVVFADLVGNTATSDYHALQLQFQSRLSHGLQTLASYSWSHSVDSGSTGSFANTGNTFASANGQNRGPSDFDIRNAFSGGLTYDLPALKSNAFTNELSRGWSVENIVQAHSAPPDDISYGFNTFRFLIRGGITNIRPDLVAGQPLYLFGAQYPGGKAFNPKALTTPPTDAQGNPLRQGNFGRNRLRGFGVTQWDFALHRDFPIHDLLKLQFRAELFNVLNHPNFGLPSPGIDQPGFGIANQMLGQSLSSGAGSGGFDPLYQIGGPRSIQLALKMTF